jgi:hypothetical protein
MANQAPSTASPEMTRATKRAAIVEAFFFVTGLAVYFTTHNMVLFWIVLAVGMAAFLAIFLPVALNQRATADDETGRSPIVEDPNGRP